ncbi:MAG TPA: alpha/beta hydrolase, partial [Terriglobales bacterium]|nr:alpha/beta hydrolase [Terriglobales bacterium]
MASPELQTVIEMLRATPMLQGDIATRRANMEMMTTTLPLAPDIAYAATDAGGVPAEWVIPPEHDPGRVLLYLHGGGYCIGSVRTHRRLVGSIARAGKIRALSVDYRLAPEHPFPAAVDDAVRAYGALLEQGVAPQRIALGGDSAGGGLTIATLLALRDRGQPLPAAGIGISPWLDLSQSGASCTSRAELDPMLDKAKLDQF